MADDTTDLEDAPSEVATGTPPPAMPDSVATRLRANDAVAIAQLGLRRINRQNGASDTTAAPAPATAPNAFANSVPTNTPSPDTLIDSALASKRAAIQAKQAEIQQHFAGGAIVNSPYGRSLIAQHEMLSDEDKRLQRDQFQQQHERAATTAVDHKTQRETQIAAHTAGFYSDMSRIKSQPGTPEYTQDLLNVAKNNWMAVGNVKKVQEDLRAAMLDHTVAGALLQPQGAELFASEDELRKAHPNATAAQDRKTGKWYVTKDSSEHDKVPASVAHDYSALKAERAAQDVHKKYAGKDSDKIDVQKNIELLDSKIASVEKEFPSLKPKQDGMPVTVTDESGTPKKVLKYNPQTGKVE